MGQFNCVRYTNTYSTLYWFNLQAAASEEQLQTQVDTLRHQVNTRKTSIHEHVQQLQMLRDEVSMFFIPITNVTLVYCLLTIGLQPLLLMIWSSVWWYVENVIFTRCLVTCSLLWGNNRDWLVILFERQWFDVLHLFGGKLSLSLSLSVCVCVWCLLNHFCHSWIDRVVGHRSLQLDKTTNHSPTEMIKLVIGRNTFQNYLRYLANTHL